MKTLEQKQINEWQPIETAPKDGTRILAFFPSEKFYLTNKHFKQSERIKIIIWSYYKRWELAESYGVLEWTFSNEPTHWMPLPKPPVKLQTTKNIEKGKLQGMEISEIKFDEYETLKEFEEDFNSAETMTKGIEKAFDNLPDNYFQTEFEKLDEELLNIIRELPKFDRIDTYLDFYEKYDKTKSLENQSEDVKGLIQTIRSWK